MLVSLRCDCWAACTCTAGAAAIQIEANSPPVIADLALQTACTCTCDVHTCLPRCVRVIPGTYCKTKDEWHRMNEANHCRNQCQAPRWTPKKTNNPFSPVNGSFHHLIYSYALTRTSSLCRLAQPGLTRSSPNFLPRRPRWR
ncbi:hypothetical protein GGI42DRAFT_309615 [Trichoderma sp. SZMC 28013]